MSFDEERFASVVVDVAVSGQADARARRTALLKTRNVYAFIAPLARPAPPRVRPGVRRATMEKKK